MRKINTMIMKKNHLFCLILILSIIGMAFWESVCLAQVPIRMSFKFILDAGGNRPATGTLNTDNEVFDQIERGNNALANLISELRIQNLEIVDVAGISQWYYVDRSEMYALRDAARANPALYSWRDDAVNVYINGYPTGGRAGYPPNNDIIMIGQSCTGDALIHEMGHIFNLKHTHEEDYCDDTIKDDPDWDRDDIATNNFGAPYVSLTPQQQTLVDTVWFNIMAYHAGDILSPCQLNSMSTQGYLDRSWIYSKEPVYVSRYSTAIFEFGSFVFPYKAFDTAYNTPGINGKIIVFQAGDYTTTQDAITKEVDIVTRFADSTITRAGLDKVLFELPSDLANNSKSNRVKSALRSVKRFDKEKEEEGAIEALITASKHAEGREKIAIQLELAQRYRHSGRYRKALEYYTYVAEATVQPYLREEVLRYIRKCKEKIAEQP